MSRPRFAGRYRAPAAPKTPYITQRGFKQLRLEEKELWSRRKETVKAITAAAAEGDRSENAEYIYRKKELYAIDARIRYLQKRMPDLKIIDTRPTDVSKVYFGATITLVNEDDEEKTYTIAGPDEIDPATGTISIDAPLARAILGKSLGDNFTFDSPAGPCEYDIIQLDYLHIPA